MQDLARLKPKERAALLLFELGGFSIPDIAEIQEEKSLSAIKSRLSRTPGQDFGFDLTLKDGKRHTRIKEQVKFKVRKHYRILKI